MEYSGHRLRVLETVKYIERCILKAIAKGYNSASTISMVVYAWIRTSQSLVMLNFGSLMTSTLAVPSFVSDAATPAVKTH